MADAALNHRSGTLVLHADHTPDQDTRSRAVPIYQTRIEHLDDLIEDLQQAFQRA